MLTKKQKILVTIVPLLMVPILAGLFLYPAVEGAKIDSSWAVFHWGDPWEVAGAGFIAGEFGVTSTVNYMLNDDVAVNDFGQNIIWLGGYGGEAIAHGVDSPFPWVQAAINQPSTIPSVQWVNSSGVWQLYTPKAVYNLAPAGSTSDYGVVTFNYDVSLRRYVLLVIGYDQYATCAGAALLAQEESLRGAGGYIVYRYSGVASPDVSSDLADYPYVIVETDG